MRCAIAAANLKVLESRPSKPAGCRGCIHYVPNDGSCIYILNTGRRRPCKPKPNGGCAAKDTGKKRSRKDIKLEGSK